MRQNFFVTLLAAMLILTVGNVNAQHKFVPTTPAPAVAQEKPVAAEPPAETPEQAAPAITDDHIKEIAAAAVADAIAKLPAPPSKTAIVTEVVKQMPSAPNYDFFFYIQGGIDLVLAIVGVVFLLLRRKSKRRVISGGAAAAILLACLIALSTVPVHAAGPTATCTPYVTKDGTPVDITCKVNGITSAGTVTFSDTNVTATDVHLTGNTLKFKATAGTAATAPNSPDMAVDTTAVGSPLAVLDNNSAALADMVVNIVKGSPAPTTGSGASSGGDDIRWHALFNSVCGVDKAHARCGREFGPAITGDELFAKLKAARNQAEENLVMGMFSNAVEFNSTDRVFQDDRFKDAAKKTADALAALNGAVQSIQGGVTETRVRAIAREEVQPATTAANEAKGIAGQALGEATRANLRLTNIEPVISANVEATQAALELGDHGGSFLGFGGGPKRDVKVEARAAGFKLFCAQTLAKTGKPGEGCPVPQSQASAQNGTAGTVVQMQPKK